MEEKKANLFDELKRFRLTWKRLYPFFEPYKKYFFFVVFLMICSSVFEPLAAASVKKFIDYLFIEKKMWIAYVAPLTIILLFLLREGSNFLYKYHREKLSLRIVQNMRISIYEHFIHLSLDHYDKMSTGEMMARTQTDVARMESTIPLTIDLGQQWAKLIGLTAVCFYMEPSLSLIAFALFPVTVFPIVRIGELMKRYTKKGLAQIATLQQHLQETYSGSRVVKAFSQEDTEVKRYYEKNMRLLGINFKYAKAKFLTGPIVNMIGALGIAFIFYLGALRILNGESQPSQFMSYIVALGLMSVPVKSLGEINGNLQTAYGAGERVVETLDKKSTVVEVENAIELPPMKEEIRYEDVSFKYEDKWVLLDFNLTAKKGQLIALVGPSGAGKTTVVNLLPRFYEITKGTITIDGIDIRKVTLKSLRDQIGLVTQETFLFNDTVENNIKYGSWDKTNEEVVQAAKAANAHDFISNLPEGYQTIIGERGIKLSGGEKQRIAIARALIKNPPILLLDEATSSLDSESEREVQKALDYLMQNRTTIAIAHRLSTIRNADLILVLNEGRVVEQGTHDELIKLKGLYCRLYEMQYFLGEFEPETKLTPWVQKL